MTETRPACAALIAVLVLVGVLGVLGATVAVAADESPDNESVEVAGPFDIDELRMGGRQVSGAAPSVRWVGDRGSLYIDYQSPNPLVFGEGDDWEAGEILEPGGLVRQDDLTFHSQLDRSADGATYELVIVYWSPGYQEITRDDETREIRIAEDQVVDRKTLEFAGSFDREEVSLRRSENEREITMWLEDPETGESIDGARWTFTHDSVATTQSAGISSWGDLLSWLGVWVVFPLIGLIVLNGVSVRWMLRRAGRGPDKGPVFWTIVIATTSVLAVGLIYWWIADVLVALPIVIPVGLATFIGIVMLETWESGVERVEFVQPSLSEAVSPSGEEALDILSVSSQFEDVVETDTGEFAVVRPGLRPFVARLFGGAAVLEGADQLSTRFDVQGSHDAKIFVTPGPDGPIDFEREGWTIDVPSLADREELLQTGLVGVMTLVFAGSIVMAFGAVWGALAFVTVVGAVTIRPTEGHARVHLAPAHMRSAFGSMLYLAKEADDAETIESARKKLVEKEARSEKDVEKALQDRDSTLVTEMFNTDVENAVSYLDQNDLEDVQDLLNQEIPDDETDPLQEVSTDD